jgi:type IV pilus assembly protein PilQ
MRSPTVNYKGLKFLTVLAFVILVCVIATAQNGTEDTNQVEVTATKPIDQTTQEQDINSTPKKAPVPLQQRMLKTVSVDCINTPIEDVIRMMGEQANVDIIKSPSVTGNVTATLTNVPLAEALNNILAVHGYGCVIDRNMIRIAPLDEIAQKGEILDNRVYRITYADVAEVESALKKFISKRGSISSNPGTSNIIVTDTGSTIKAIDTFIDEIDRITPQVMVEVRIYDVTSTEGFDIWSEWTAGRNNPITSSTRTDTHTITDTVDTVTPANTGTVTTDVDAVTKTTNTAWQESDAGLAAGTESYAYRKSKPFIGGNFDSDIAGTIRLGLLDTVNVEIALNILRTQVGAKLLANPRILVLDNETAEFKIISEIPYTETSDTSAGGSMTSTQFKEVGVELKVKPHITRDGMIRLDIVPKFSVVSELGSIIPNSGGLRGVPTIDAREVDTKALVKDGQTVVLGGLRKRTVSQDISKIPLLGDVPILGNIFTSVEEEVETNELIVFLTPRIVVEPTLSPKERKGFEATEFGGPRVSYTENEKAEKRAEKKVEKITMDSLTK